MNTNKGPLLDEEYSCNSALTGANDAGCDDNPRLSGAAWSDIKLIKHHGAYSIYTATRYGRKYLLKSLSESHKNIQEWQRLLFKEFELGFQFDHPNIARTIGWESIPEIGETIVMEYVDGRELRQWLKTDRQHLRKERLNVVKQIAEALVYIHSMGISHRDLKPDNILVTHKGCHAKIIDFGHGDGEDFLVYKRAAGTKSFGAPEQINGDAETSMSADIYSLGKIMQLMFPGLQFRHLINSCLQNNPSARPSAAEVLKSLNRKAYIIPIAICLFLVTLLAAGTISYNLKMAKTHEAANPSLLKATADTVNIQKTDTVIVETPSKPSEASIKAVWDKVLKDIDPQIKFYATYNFPDPEEHENHINDLISDWGERLYFSLLEIGCTKAAATAKRKALANHIRHRLTAYSASKPSPPTDTSTIP